MDMEVLIILALVAVILLPLVLSIAAFVRSGKAKRATEDLQYQIRRLERQLREGGKPVVEPPSPGPVSAPAPATPAPPIEPYSELPEPPPIPDILPSPSPRVSAPPTAEPRLHHPVPPVSSRAARPAIDWEQFMGAKLFAWLGGFALFLGVAFFVKYSFEHNLISPELRVAIGFLTGLGLLIGGVFLKQRAYAVTAQTLCATGVLILYAVTFACRAFYHFAFFGLVPTLLLMSLITAVAFVLAVRLEAQVVAVLGMLGGFLTPILLSTGQDNPWGLFGYIAVIDLGLIAITLRRPWHYLVQLGALGTVLMLCGWAERFFVAGKYFEGARIFTPLGVLLGLVVLFAAGAWLALRREPARQQLSWPALAMAATALAFAAYFLTFERLAERPVLIFGFVFLVDLVILALVVIDRRIAAVQPVSGLAIFTLLGAWTAHSLSDSLLNAALGLFLVFTIFHAVTPIVLSRLGRTTAATKWTHAFPALALLLTLGPLLSHTAISFLIWPFVLLVDVLAVILAVITGALLPILLVLVLTLAVTGIYILRIPATLVGLPTSLLTLGVFAVFFLVASVWATRRLSTRLPAGPRKVPPEFLPSCSVALPFLLLIMITARLPIANPSPVFGLALLLVVLLFGVTKLLAVEVLPLIGLISTVALESSWHFARFNPERPFLALGWYLVFYAVFTIYPFLFHRAFAGKSLPWIAAALSGPLHFYLVHRLVFVAFPDLWPMMGLVPAAFALPPLAGLFLVLKRTPLASPARLSQLAWLGGAALFFITLIFPIQFDREWITIGWALEGAALCWFFHRVPHPGLRLVGVALLVTAFARLALNPAVLGYHARSSVAIFNWYLYTYGLATVCLFAGARWLAPPRHLVLGRNASALLASLGTILAFLLVNIEIADYFTGPGTAVVTLQFSGNLARDMSYSMAWALFALLLVIIGIRKRLAAVRYAGLALLGATLLKLFIHDLSQLGQLYRIAALLVVALVAIGASFLYQRFLAAAAAVPSDETPRLPRILELALIAVLAACLSPSAHALTPSEWKSEQTLVAPAAGLVRVDLPPATLDAARPGLEDLRLLDASGAEVPFLVEHPTPAPAAAAGRRSTSASRSRPPTTVLGIETGLDVPLGAVVLDSPARDFIKSVRVEGSQDARNWQELAERPAHLPPGERRERAARGIPARRLGVAAPDHRRPPRGSRALYRRATPRPQAARALRAAARHNHSPR